MAKKKTPNEIVLEQFGEAKQHTDFFRSLSLEAYHGYITAIVARDNPKEGLSVKEWFDVVGQELVAGNL